MTYFAERYRFDRMKTAGRILAIPAGHHRLNYLHPFPDGNGRVSRLMSDAMAQLAGIGAHVVGFSRACPWARKAERI